MQISFLTHGHFISPSKMSFYGKGVMRQSDNQAGIPICIFHWVARPDNYRDEPRILKSAVRNPLYLEFIAPLFLFSLIMG